MKGIIADNGKVVVVVDDVTSFDGGVLYTESGSFSGFSTTAKVYLVADDSSVAVGDDVYSMSGVLDSAKSLKKDELANERWMAEVAPFAYKEHHFDTSEWSQIKYLSVKEPTVWKTYDGWIQMELADFTTLVENYESHVKALFAKEQMLCDVVDAATTPQELEGIAW